MSSHRESQTTRYTFRALAALVSLVLGIVVAEVILRINE
jgi:hypothetical protein